MKNRFILLSGFSSLVVLGICLGLSPHEESVDSILARQTRPVLAPAITYSSAPLAQPVVLVSQYRGESSRRGAIVPMDRLPDFLRSEWSINTLNLDLHAASKSSPVFDASGIYVGADSGWFRKFDFAGKLIWSFFVNTPRRGVHSTPALSAETVYFGAYNGWFYALDKMSGEPRWAVSLGHAIGASPLILGTDIYITVETETNGFVAKLDAASGRAIWSSEYLGDQAHSSVTFDSQDQLLIVGTNARSIMAIDLKDGSTRWKFKSEAEIKGTGVFVDGLYIVGAVDGQVFALSGAAGEKQWSSQVPGRIVGSVTADVAKGLGMISSTTGLYAFSLRDGRSIWSHRYKIRDGQDSFGRQTPVLAVAGAKRAIWAQCEARQLCIFDEQKGTRLRTFAIRGNISNTPGFYANHLYLAYDQEGLEAFAFQSEK